MRWGSSLLILKQSHADPAPFHTAAYVKNIAKQFSAKQKINRIPVIDGTWGMVRWPVTLICLA